MTGLPTAEEINEYDSLDGTCASEHFLGKSLEAAKQMLLKKPQVYCEDLTHMSAKAFAFYVRAAVESVKASTEYDMIDAMYPVARSRLRLPIDSLGTEVMAEIIDYIVEHFDQFHPVMPFDEQLKQGYVQLREQAQSPRPDRKPKA